MTRGPLPAGRMALSLLPVALVLGLTAEPAVPQASSADAPHAAAFPGAAPGASLLDSWRDAIRPCDTERAWERIGWQTSFAAGLRAADAAGKPLLLWMMNGHPLGCT